MTQLSQWVKECPCFRGDIGLFPPSFILGCQDPNSYEPHMGLARMSQLSLLWSHHLSFQQSGWPGVRVRRVQSDDWYNSFCNSCCMKDIVRWWKWQAAQSNTMPFKLPPKVITSLLLSTPPWQTGPDLFHHLQGWASCSISKPSLTHLRCPLPTYRLSRPFVHMAYFPQWGESPLCVVICWKVFCFLQH